MRNAGKGKIAELVENFSQRADGNDDPLSPLLRSSYLVPGKVKIQNGRLRWDFRLPGGKASKRVTMTAANLRKLLGDFLELADSKASDAQIEDFARHWGVLGLCWHGLPRNHLPLHFPPRYAREQIELAAKSFRERATKVEAQKLGTGMAERFVKNRNIEEGKSWFRSEWPRAMSRIEHHCTISIEHLCAQVQGARWPCERKEDLWQRPDGEPLAAYRHFAQEAQTILKLAGDVREGKLGGKKDWEFLLHNWDSSRDTDFKVPDWLDGRDEEASGLFIRKYTLTTTINHWLEMTGVRPGISWFDEKASFTLLGPPLMFGVSPGENVLAFVALQMMLMVTRQVGFGQCSYCGKFFDLKPGQSASRGCYCPRHKDPRFYNQVAAKAYRTRNRTEPDRARRTRLTVQEVKNIRRDFDKWKAAEADFYRRYAEKYSKTERAIRKIIARDVWADIE
jgi:hypothetical protein